MLGTALSPVVFGKENQISIYKGSPAEIGNAHGQGFKTDIKHSLDVLLRKIKTAGYSDQQINEVLSARKVSLKEHAPHILEEYQAIASTTGVSLQDILALNTFIGFGTLGEKEGNDECTSWLAVGTATMDGRSYLHKNRDFYPNPQAVFKVSGKGKNSFLAISDKSWLVVTSGMNDKGLAISNNVVGFNNLNLFGLDAFTIHRRVLEEAETVEEAYELIKNFPRINANIFFIVDREKGAIIEADSKEISSFEDSIVVNGFGARANMFEILSGSTNWDSIRRSGAAKAFLQQRLGSISILDMNNLSRHIFVYNDGIASDNDSSDGLCVNKRLSPHRKKYLLTKPVLHQNNIFL